MSESTVAAGVPAASGPTRGVRLVSPIPGPRARAIVDRDRRALMTSTKSAPIVAASASGVWVTDVDGNRLLDFAAGIAVHAVGHCHPDVVRAIREQAGTLAHFAGTDFYYDLQVTLAEKIASLAPGTHEKKVFFTNSGTESAEAALKIARWQRQRPITIGLLGGFHGRSMGALTMTASKAVQRARFAPYAGGGHHIPAPNCYRCPYQLEYPSCDLYCAKILKELYFETTIPPDDVAAFIAEPVMGEGGYVVPPKGWFAEIKRILDEQGILLIADEVQSGVGRTGAWFAIEHHGVVPDLVTMAKAIGGGLPMGAVILRADLDLAAGAHSNTFGGNLVASAASLAMIGVIERERLLENARTQGGRLKQQITEIARHHPEIGDVRGIGLMVATEFVRDRTTKEPDPRFRDRVLEESYKRGLILLGCGRSSIRYIPPLIVRPEEIDEGVEILDAAIRAARAAP
jgi:4-aminobutyrate aminotransferase